MQSKQLDLKNKNWELSKLKLKFVFDFPIGMEYHLKPEIKTLLNSQLQFFWMAWSIFQKGSLCKLMIHSKMLKKTTKTTFFILGLTALRNNNYSCLFMFWLLCHHIGGQGLVSQKQCICMVTKVRKVSDGFDGCCNKC